MPKKRMFVAGLVLLIMVGSYYFLQRYGLLNLISDPGRLNALVMDLGAWGPVGIVFLMALAIIMNPVPSAPIALVAGAAYGHSWGTIFIVIGATTGAFGAFWIARWLGQDLMLRLLGERIREKWYGSQTTLMALVFVSRLMPFISFDLVSYGAGLTPLKAWRFLLATLAGLIPASFLLAHFGGELAQSSLQEAVFFLLALGFITLIPLLVKGVSHWYTNR